MSLDARLESCKEEERKKTDHGLDGVGELECGVLVQQLSDRPEVRSPASVGHTRVSAGHPPASVGHTQTSVRHTHASVRHTQTSFDCEVLVQQLSDRPEVRGPAAGLVVRVNGSG